MVRGTRLLVVSDLDGTLLDHETYSFDAARPALDALAAHRLPLVLASSKTCAEIRDLQTAMDLGGLPAIVENGAGIVWSADAETESDESYRKIRAILSRVPGAAHFKGFGDLTKDEIAKVTGLSSGAAADAKRRCHSEPGLWSGGRDELAAFLGALRAEGIHTRSGGRFLTLSFGRTKADAMMEVVERLVPQRTLALGDAPNDVEMLEAADIGVIVRNDHAPALPLLAGETEGRLRRTDAPGPGGWNSAVLAVLREIGLERHT